MWWEDIKMISDTNGWAIGVGYTDMGFTYGTYFYRYNSGTWTQQSLKGANLTDMSVINTNSIWAVGMNADRFHRTFTYAKWNGTIWSVTNATPLVSGQLDEVACDFADANHGYVVGGRFYDFSARYENGTWYYDSWNLTDVAHTIDMTSTFSGWCGGSEYNRYYGDQHLHLIPDVASPGQRLTARVANLTPSTRFWITWETPPSQISAQILEPIQTDLQGNFETEVYVPSDASSGNHAIILSTLQLVPGQGVQYVEVTRGEVSVRDGLVYSVAMPDTTYLRLGGWGGMAVDDVTVEIAARVSSMLPPQPAANLPMTCQVRSSPPAGCSIDPIAPQTDGDGFYRFEVSPAEGVNVIDVFPDTSPMDRMSIRVIGYMQPPPPDPLPPGFIAQAWTGRGALRDIEISPNWGPAGTRFAIKGYGFTPAQFAYAYWDGTDLLGQTHTGNGRFSLQANVPASTGEHTVVLITHSGDYAYKSFYVQDQSPDTIPPVVSITYPPQNAVVSGTITVQAGAVDSRAVSSMELTLDNQLMARSTSGSISSVWDTHSASPGLHTLMTIATDRQGNRGIAAVQVTVDNTGGDHLAPDVTIVSPTAGQPVTGQVQVELNATDNTSVSMIAAYLDDTTLIGSGQGSVYNFTFNANDFSEGTHTLRAVAYDPARNPGERTISIQIVSSSFDPDKPVITVIAPGSWQNMSGISTIHATATDNSGMIPQMTAWLGNTHIAGPTAGVINIEYDSTQQPSDIYNLVFFAVDNAGHQATKSVPVSICNLPGRKGSRRGYSNLCSPDNPAIFIDVKSPSQDTLLSAYCEFNFLITIFSPESIITEAFLLLTNTDTDVVEIRDEYYDYDHKGINILNPVHSFQNVGHYTLRVSAKSLDGTFTHIDRDFEVSMKDRNGLCIDPAVKINTMEDVDSMTIHAYSYKTDIFDVNLIRLEMLNSDTSEYYLLEESDGEPIEVVLDYDDYPIGNYTLIASGESDDGVSVIGDTFDFLVSQGTLISPDEIRLVCFNNTDTMNSLTDAVFESAISTLDARGIEIPYSGEILISSSQDRDMIQVGDTEVFLPYLLQLTPEDDGAISFNLIAQSPGIRTITAECEALVTTTSIEAIAEGDELVFPGYTLDCDLAIFWNVDVSVELRDPEGDLQIVDMIFGIRTFENQEFTVQKSHVLSMYTQSWDIMSIPMSVGQPHQAWVQIHDRLSGHVIGYKSFTFYLGEEPDQIGIFIQTGLHDYPWQAVIYDMEAVYSGSGGPVFLWDAEVQYQITYPGNVIKHGTSYSQWLGEVFLDLDGPPMGTESGMTQVQVWAFLDGYKPGYASAYVDYQNGWKRDGVLQFNSTAPILISGPNQKQIGQSGSGIVSSYPGAFYRNAVPNSGYIPIASGDIIHAAMDASRIYPGYNHLLNAELQMGTGSSTLGILNADPVTYGLQFVANNSNSRLDLPLPEPALTLTATLPMNRASDVASDMPLTLNFSKPVEPSSFTYEFLPDPGNISIAWNPSNTIAVISHNSFAADSYYYFNILTASDTGGMPITRGAVPPGWSFTTRAVCPGRDNDMDGYVSAECGGTDCDDNDEDIHPDAPELKTVSMMIATEWLMTDWTVYLRHRFPTLTWFTMKPRTC